MLASQGRPELTVGRFPPPPSDLGRTLSCCQPATSFRCQDEVIAGSGRGDGFGRSGRVLEISPVPPVPSREIDGPPPVFCALDRRSRRLDGYPARQGRVCHSSPPPPGGLSTLGGAQTSFRNPRICTPPGAGSRSASREPRRNQAPKTQAVFLAITTHRNPRTHRF